MAYISDNAFDRESLRRQFRLSVGLVLAMMAAAFILGSALPVGSVKPSMTVDESGDFSGRLVSVDD